MPLATGLSITYYNLGVRRNTSRDIRQHWEEECTQKLPEWLESVDCWVVFSFGVNDIVIETGVQRVPLQESLDNARLIRQKSQTQYTALWVSPPPTVDADHNERIQTLSETFSHLADKLHVPYIPVLPALIANEEHKPEVKENNGAHPQKYGLCRTGAHYRSFTAVVFLNRTTQPLISFAAARIPAP